MTASTMYLVCYFDTYHSFKHHIKHGLTYGCIVHTSTDDKECKRIARKLMIARWNLNGKTDRYYFVKSVTPLTFAVPVCNF